MQRWQGICVLSAAEFVPCMWMCDFIWFIRQLRNGLWWHITSPRHYADPDFNETTLEIFSQNPYSLQKLVNNCHLVILVAKQDYSEPDVTAAGTASCIFVCFLICKYFLCRYINTGDSFRTISVSFRIGISTIQEIICDVAEAIWEELAPEFMPAINSPAQWKIVVQGFLEKWQFLHCCGALDGKHCTVQKPPKTGSLFWNYKRTFSIVLMALVDSDYKYIMVDVGAAGLEGDSNTFRNSAFRQQFMANRILFPLLENLPSTTTKAPFVLIGDEAFLGEMQLLKPYSKKTKTVSEKTKAVFNYRLSHACMCVECSFGILSSRFRFLFWCMTLSLGVATSMIKATCVLHNFLLKDSDPFVQAAVCRMNAKICIACAHGCEFGMLPFPNLPGHHTSTEAWQVQNIFATYSVLRKGSFHGKTNMHTSVIWKTRQRQVCVLFDKHFIPNLYRIWRQKCLTSLVIAWLTVFKGNFMSNFTRSIHLVFWRNRSPCGIPWTLPMDTGCTWSIYRMRGVEGSKIWLCTLLYGTGPWGSCMLGIQSVINQIPYLCEQLFTLLTWTFLQRKGNTIDKGINI